MNKNQALCDLASCEPGPLDSRRYEEKSRAERVFVDIWELEADVNNGGFDQYLFNSGGDHVATVPASLRAIGAHRMADIVERVIATAFPSREPIRNWVARQEHVLTLPTDLFERLDHEFYAYPDDLTELLHTFVMSNRASIHGAERI